MINPAIRMAIDRFDEKTQKFAYMGALEPIESRRAETEYRAARINLELAINREIQNEVTAAKRRTMTSGGLR